MRLQSKFSLAAILLIALPMLVVAWRAYLQLHETTSMQVKQQLESYLDQQVQSFNVQRESALFALGNLAADKVLVNYFLAENDSMRYGIFQLPLLHKMDNIQKGSVHFQEIRILLPDGFEDQRIARGNIENTQDEEALSPFFQNLLTSKRPYSLYIDLNPDTGFMSLYLTLPIYLRNPARESINEKPSLRGYVSITLDLEGFFQMALPSHWSEGRLFLSHNKRLLIPSADLLPILNDPLENDTQWKNLQHNKQNHWFKRFPLYEQWQLNVLMPEHVMLKSSRQVGEIVLWTSISALLISLPILLWWLRRTFITPIESLNRALAAISSSQDFLQVKTTGNNDELDELNQAFNHMSQSLYESNQNIHKLAYYDPLTGLPNRSLFSRILKRSLDKAERENSTIALMFLDLDNFKHVNDNLGHPVGDALLKKVTQRLSESLRAGDVSYRVDKDTNSNLSRLGGDEFTLLLPNLSNAESAGYVAQRLINAISEPFVIQDHEIYVGTSIGIALWPIDGQSMDDLLAHADAAMYLAKQRGKNNYQFFSQVVNDMNQRRVEVGAAIRRALLNNGLRLYYQPVVDSRNYQVCSFEALLRLNDLELGELSPAEFIPVAEEYGLILELGQWVIDEACRQLKEWRDSDQTCRVGINLSALQLHQVDIVAQIKLAMDAYGVSSHEFYVELTESAVLDGDDKVLEKLRTLQKMGLSVALDDFGTGYSSLSYLRHLPIDILKIDRSFLDDLEDANNKVIVSAIISLSHALNLTVIAEGVEEISQLIFLAKEENILIQGYLFSPPLPAGKAIDFLNKPVSTCHFQPL